MSQASSSQPAGSASLLRGQRAVAVEVLVCGSSDRGDDGAPIAATGSLGTSLPSDVAVRTVGQLDIDDLLSIPRDAGVVVVDAATGIERAPSSSCR